MWVEASICREYAVQVDFDQALACELKLHRYSRHLIKTFAILPTRYFLLLAILGVGCAFASDRISEQSAVAQLKKAPAYELDGSLPNRSFGSWVMDKFRNWDIQWEMHECGDTITKNSKGEVVQEGPVCVQVNIMLPGQKIHGEASDGFHLLFLVGTEKRGLSQPKLRSASRTDGDAVVKLQGLAEVEP